MRLPFAAALAASISCVTLPPIEGFALSSPPLIFADDDPWLAPDAALSARERVGVDDSTLAAVTPPMTAATTTDDLGPSSDPPWNPPRAKPRRRAWEYAVLLPQRIATAPLSVLGAATDRSLLWLEDHNVAGRLVNVSRELPRRTGVGIRLASLGDRTGLGGQVVAYTSFLPGRFRNFVTLAHSASTRHYHDTEAHFFGRPFGVEYRNQWRPQERFHGIGMRTREEDISSYAVSIEHVRGNLGFHWNRGEAGEPEPRTGFNLWLGTRSIVMTNGREPGRVDVGDRFPEVVSSTLDQTYEQMTYGVRFSSDWRMGRPRWWEGWRVIIESERFDIPRKELALETSHAGAQFTRTILEMEGAHSFGAEPRSIRFLGRFVNVAISRHHERMEIFDLSSLGGRAGLRGFQPGRFRDSDLLLGRVSYIFTLVRRLELDLHVETGGVFSNVWKTSRLDRFEQSAGIALRGRPSDRVAGAVGFDFCREGVRLRYTLGNPDP